MKSILIYIRRYSHEMDIKTFIFITIFTSILVFNNYQFGLDTLIRKNNSFPVKLFCWYVVFLVAFSIPYVITSFLKPQGLWGKRYFIFLLLAAPLLFALKLSLNIPFPISRNLNWNNYWNHIIYWPLLLFIISGVLFLLWKYFDKQQ